MEKQAIIVDAVYRINAPHVPFRYGVVLLVLPDGAVCVRATDPDGRFIRSEREYNVTPEQLAYRVK